MLGISTVTGGGRVGGGGSWWKCGGTGSSHRELLSQGGHYCCFAFLKRPVLGLARCVGCESRKLDTDQLNGKTDQYPRNLLGSWGLMNGLTVESRVGTRASEIHRPSLVAWLPGELSKSVSPKREGN